MSDDLIKRSDVYKAVDDWLEGKVPNLNIKDIPSADRPQGEWKDCGQGKERKADTPQTTLCRECDDYAGDGMYCASNYIVYDFSTSRENCEADTRQTNIDKAKADIAKWSSWSKTYESMCESQTDEEFEEPNYYDPALWE